MDSIAPHLSKHDVRFVAIGLEDLGSAEFHKGNFFSGELYIDPTKKTFSDLQFKDVGLIQMLPSLFDKKARDAINKSREQKIGGDMKGDKNHYGGVLVVDKGGKLVFLYRQQHFAEFPTPEEILQSLGIS
ncbi:unnamed protein product [Darwinula stevensoni]|uniref:Uncharacterized protein n=1 Tax=Darwinula stevensoni TaxID=69355 RepID=A0A7R8X2Q7_9CRUS|nr:unnamed protein product [Darwinula stevensoni]CAG0881724.1 unnamed protein product [Darwinula stevensoni]